MMRHLISIALFLSTPMMQAQWVQTNPDGTQDAHQQGSRSHTWRKEEILHLVHAELHDIDGKATVLEVVMENATQRYDLACAAKKSLLCFAPLPDKDYILVTEKDDPEMFRTMKRQQYPGEQTGILVPAWADNPKHFATFVISEVSPAKGI